MSRYTTEQRRKLSKRLIKDDTDPTRIDRNDLSNQMDTAFSSRVDEDENNREMFLQLNAELTGYQEEQRNMTGYEKPALYEKTYSYERLNDSEELENTVNPAAASYTTVNYRDSYQLQESARLEEQTIFFEDPARVANQPEPRKPARYDIDGISYLGNAAYFNGDDSYIESTNAIDSLSVWTISLWIYLSEHNDLIKQIISIGDGTDYDIWIQILEESNDTKIKVGLTDTTPTEYTQTWATSLELETWYHIVFIYDGSNLQGYLNNSKDATDIAASITPRTTASRKLELGRLGDSGTWIYNFNGFIDDVRIYNKVLSTLEIKRIYENRNIIAVPYYWPDKDLLAYYPLNNNSYDLSGNGNEGTDTNITYSSNTAEFNATTSLITISASETINNIWTNGVSISLRIYPETMGENSEGHLFDKNTWQIFLTDESAGTCKLKLIQTFDISNGEWISTDRIITLNSWNDIIIYFNNAFPVIYINGIEITITEFVSPDGILGDDSSDNLIIGNSIATDRTFDGFIDEIRFYNRELLEKEIKTLYNQKTILNNQNLLIYYPLNNIANDYSINDNHGTENEISYDNGNVRYSIESKAAYFNGINSYISLNTELLETSFTFSTWVYYFDYVNSFELMSTDHTSGSTYEMFFNNGTFDFYDDSQNSYSLNLGTLTNEEWYFLTITCEYDDLFTTIIIYNNTELIDNVKFFGKIQLPDSALELGRYGTDYFKGYLDDTRFYNTAITKNEIYELYNLREIELTNLLARYSFDNNINNSAQETYHGIPYNITFYTGIIPGNFEDIYYPSELDFPDLFTTIRDYYDSGGTGGEIPNGNIYGEYVTWSEDTPEEDQTYMTLGVDNNFELSDNLIAEYTFDENVGVSNDELAAYYKLDGNANDNSINTNNGTTVDIDYVSGINYKAAKFNGINSRIVVTDDSSIQNVFNNGGSVSVWLNVFSDGGLDLGGIIDKRAGGTISGWLLYLKTEVAGYCGINFYKDFSSNQGRWYTTTNDIALNEWYHVVLTYDSSSVSNDPNIYINGNNIPITEVNTPSGTSSSDVGKNLYIGERSTLDLEFDGLMDEVRIYKRVLSYEEVKMLYNNPGPYETDFTAITDSSDNGYDGTPTNISINNFGKFNTAALFNGIDSDISLPSEIYSNIDETSNWSISFWMRLHNKTFTTNQAIFSFDGTGFVRLLYDYTDENLTFQINDGSTTTEASSTNNSISKSIWYFITITYDNIGAMNIYINTTNDGGNNYVDTFSITSGNIGNDATNYFDGLIDQFRVFNKELSQTEINRLYYDYIDTFYMNEFNFKNNFIWINPTDSDNFSFGKILKCKQKPAQILYSPICERGTIPDNAAYTKDFTAFDANLLEVLNDAVLEYKSRIQEMIKYFDNNRNADKEFNKKILTDLNNAITAFETWEEDIDPTSLIAINTLIESLKPLRHYRFLSRLEYIKNYLISSIDLYEDRLDIIGYRLNKLDGTLKEMMEVQIGAEQALNVYDRQETRETWYQDYLIVKRSEKDGEYKRRLFVEDPNNDLQVGDWVYILSDNTEVPELYAKIALIVDGRIASYENSDVDLTNTEVDINYKDVKKLFFKNVIFTADYKTDEYTRIIKEIGDINNI